MNQHIWKNSSHNTCSTKSSLRAWFFWVPFINNTGSLVLWNTQPPERPVLWKLFEFFKSYKCFCSQPVILEGIQSTNTFLVLICIMDTEWFNSSIPLNIQCVLFCVQMLRCLEIMVLCTRSVQKEKCWRLTFIPTWQVLSEVLSVCWDVRCLNLTFLCL